MPSSRRKSKSGNASASGNGDDSSQLSKSSKKSFMGKLISKKKKKSKSGSSSRDVASTKENDSTTINNKSVDNNDKVQQGFLQTNGQEAKKPYMLKIALLLVDAKTRRFELLQLEFDSDKALVSDALSQIPIHVTEKVLSSQTYTGVCGADGVERKRTVPLFDFCKGNDVLVAIPSGTTAEECARLAKPILSDEKVIGMLSTSGINADPWTKAAIAPPRADRKNRQMPKAPKDETPKESGGSTTVLFYGLIVVIIAAVLFLFFNKSKSVAMDGAEPGEPSEPWSAPAIPEVPSMDLEAVWAKCHSACDASRDFMESYVVSPTEKRG